MKKIQNIDEVRPSEYTPRTTLANILQFIRVAVGGDRFQNLYKALSNQIQFIKDSKQTDLMMLDYGCGAMEFSSRFHQQGLIKSYDACDIFPCPTILNENDKKWQNYQQIKKGEVPQLGSYDLTIIVDVLHHASHADQIKILQGLAKISKIILVKDHFEYGFFSRQFLRLADWYGNYAYGVDVPKRYFDKESWVQLVQKGGLCEIKRIDSVLVHEGLFGIMIPPKYHFISILESQNFQ